MMVLALQSRRLVPLSDYFHLVGLHVVFICLFQGAMCRLVTQPENAVVMRTNHVNMNCTSNGDNGLLRWLTGPEKAVLWTGNRLVEDVSQEQRYTVSRFFKGNVNLNVTAATDTKFSCQEPGSLEEASAQMIVLENEPECRYNKTNDLLELECSMHYYGAWQPEFLWKQLDGVKETNLAGELNTTIENKSAYRSRLKVPTPDLTKNYTYVCIIRFSTVSTPLQVTATNELSHRCNCQVSVVWMEIEKEADVSGYKAGIVILAMTTAVGIILVIIFYLRQRKTRQELKDLKRKQPESEKQRLQEKGEMKVI